MRRWWLIAGGAAGVAAVVALARRMRSSGYAGDAIDAAGQGATFGERDGAAPEQLWSPAETRTDVTVEELSTAARVEVSLDAIRTVWPAVDEDDIQRGEGDLDRLARTIAEKVEQPFEQVRRRLDDILARETPRGSYPPH